jgi:hypothetical protein
VTYATDADLLLRIPAASAVAVALRTVALADAETLIDDRSYADRAVPAHVYLAAHLLALQPDSALGGEGGAVTSIKAGEIQTSFSAPSFDVGETLSLTKYGRAYIMIRDTVVCAAGVYG